MNTLSDYTETFFEREQFTFYKSFEEAISVLPEEEQLKVYRGIVRYSLFGEDPGEMPKCLSPIGQMAWKLIFPIIRSSRIKAHSGKAGGGSSKVNNPAGNNQYSKEDKQKDKQEDKQDKDKGKGKGKDNNILGVATPNEFSNLIDWIDSNEELQFMANRNNFKTYLTAKNLSLLQQSYSIEEIKRGILDLENRKDFQEKGFITFFKMLKTYLDGNVQYW